MLCNREYIKLALPLIKSLRIAKSLSVHYLQLGPRIGGWGLCLNTPQLPLIGTQLVGRLLSKVLLVFDYLIRGISKKNSPGIYLELDFCWGPRQASIFSNVLEQELGNIVTKYVNDIKM